jgi:hypothetical protein
VPPPLGVDGEPLGDEPPLGGVVVVPGDVDGEPGEGGDADGEPPGRSLAGPVGDSLQAVSTPTLSARAQRPVSILFMSGSLLIEWLRGTRTMNEEGATAMPLGSAMCAMYMPAP